MGIQWERRTGGLQGSVLPCWFTGPGADPCHCWPPGKRVHHRGLGRVDRVWGQGAGCQWHWDGAVEPASERQDERVWWVRTSSVNRSPHVCGSDDDRSQKWVRTNASRITKTMGWCFITKTRLSRNSCEIRISRFKATVTLKDRCD